MPHKRVVRNLRKLLKTVADNPSERSKYIEDLLLALPRGSRQRRTDDDEWNHSQAQAKEFSERLFYKNSIWNIN